MSPSAPDDDALRLHDMPTGPDTSVRGRRSCQAPSSRRCAGNRVVVALCSTCASQGPVGAGDRGAYRLRCGDLQLGPEGVGDVRVAADVPLLLGSLDPPMATAAVPSGSHVGQPVVAVGRRGVACQQADPQVRWFARLWSSRAVRVWVWSFGCGRWRSCWGSVTTPCGGGPTAGGWRRVWTTPGGGRSTGPSWRGSRRSSRRRRGGRRRRRSSAGRRGTGSPGSSRRSPRTP